MTESINQCPVCQGVKFEDFLDAIDYTTSNERFKIVKCADCQLLITNPRPDQEDIGKYYESENYISHTGEDGLMGAVYRLIRKYNIKQKYNLIQSLNPPGKSILDYGCGTGEFINYFKKIKWETSGVEPNQAANLKAAKLLNQPIYRSIKEIEKNQFDVITLWHVLEHIHELNEIVSLIVSKLNTNGILIIAVPNPNSKDARLYNKHWAAYDVPRHLWHFNQESIKKLMNNHGMNFVRTSPMIFDSIYVSLLSEHYKRSTNSKFIKIIKALFNGLSSNLTAIKTTEYSSIIYCFQKK